jgi:DNA-directed RNA polymerase specialized sigma24 family protein
LERRLHPPHSQTTPKKNKPAPDQRGAGSKDVTLVHLREVLSNLTPNLQRILADGVREKSGRLPRSHLVGYRQDAAVRFHLQQAQVRLSPASADALISAYQSGRSIAALSRDFKINKSTVQAHLVRANVRLRPQKVLTADQAAQVVTLYMAGKTLKELGSKFGVGHNTVRNYLLRAGVEMRAAKRRPCQAVNTGRNSWDSAALPKC